MYVQSMIHKLLSDFMHLKRLYSLISVVQGAFEAKQFSVTGLGRALPLAIQERSGIRKVDRLVGNEKLHSQRKDVYCEIASLLIGNVQKPWILVDWSLVPNTTHQLLRAALVCEGRALSIYEEVHPESKLANRKVHQSFLKSLKKVLPKDCCPVIVTDAGYHTGWFKVVKKLGWDFVGRVRGQVHYLAEGKSRWQNLKSVHKKATKTPKKLGHVTLSKTEPLNGMMCFYKGTAKNRRSMNKLGQRRQSTRCKTNSKAAKEPWVLITSLDGKNVAKKVVRIYKSRMQIEEGFRDLKSSKYGFGFEQAQSRKIMRIENLLLIAMLASFVAWSVGWFAEKEERHYEFQANSIKNRRVLSLFYLGCRIIKKKIEFKIGRLSNITKELEWAKL